MNKVNHSISSEKKGIIFAILSSLSLGLAGITDKLGTTTIKQPFLYSTETIFFALCFTIFYFLFSNRKPGKSLFTNLKPISWIQLLIIGSFASGIVILLRFIGLLQSTGTFASLSQVITTCLTAILANLFLKEKLSKEFWILFLLIIASTYFMSVGSFDLISIKKGDAYIITATIFLALANIVTKKALPKINPIQIAVGRFFFGFLFLLLINIFFLLHTTTLSFTYFAILSGLFWTGNVIFFNISLKHIGATLTTTILMLAPILTMTLEITLLHHKFTIVQYIAAGIVVLTGIIIALRRK